ncbi:MAG: hypothetical protein PHP66_10055 [Syntrophales bacterium]|nr:hypothetical protein [Syntrophales bacterium]
MSVMVCATATAAEIAPVAAIALKEGNPDLMEKAAIAVSLSTEMEASKTDVGVVAAVNHAAQ